MTVLRIVDWCPRSAREVLFVLGFYLLAGHEPRGSRMDRARYEEAKRALSEVRHELETAPLTAQQRDELERHAAALSGVLMSPWLPMSLRSRLIALAIILFGLQQAWTGNYEPMVFWFLLPLFSPRIVGECAHLLGRVAGLFRG
jgi:hypothetical protein